MFTKQLGLRIHMARWCDGGRTQRSRLGTITDKPVKRAKRRTAAAETTLGKVQIEKRCLKMSTRSRIWEDTAISPVYNLLLGVRQQRLRYLGHMLCLPRYSVVRRTLMAMTGGDNRYPEGNLFMDCQGSELIDLEILAVNRTALRHKVATLVF